VLPSLIPHKVVDETTFGIGGEEYHGSSAELFWDAGWGPEDLIVTRVALSG